MGENVYTSSDSDSDDVDDEAVVRESRPLLVNGEQVDHQQVERPMQDPAITGGQSSGSLAPASIARRRRTPLKWTEVIWITVTLSLIAVLGYSSQLCIMLPYYHKTPSFSPQGLAAVLVPLNLGLLGIFYNYWLCVTTDPGSVPVGYQPDWSALDPLPPGTGHWGHSQTRADLTAGETEPTLELKQALYRPRYCKTCSAYKPPRTHHCKTCQRCVLRMDHHCPWVANCVGHHNYAHFLRFLFYVDVTCVYHLVMVSCRVLDRFNSYTYWREPSTRELVWLVVNYALCIPVILLVGIFSIYHFYCTAINQTTIESWEKDRTATMIRRGRIRKVKYPYDLGVWSNCKAVLGENPLLWCIPNATLDAGDGLTFPVAKGLGKCRSTRAVSLRLHRSEQWQAQTAGEPAGGDGAAVLEMHAQRCTSSGGSDEEGEGGDDECYVDAELEASVLHRLRWENWHRQQQAQAQQQQTRWRHQAATPAVQDEEQVGA